MPIRFRCAYCNQLMGISRRKAGTIVKCPNPKCGGEIIVPVPEGESPENMPANPADALEELNFDPRAEGPPDGSAGATAAAETPPHPTPVRPVPTPPKRFGIFLGIETIVISVVVILLLLVLMFVLGLIVGRQTIPAV